MFLDTKQKLRRVVLPLARLLSAAGVVPNHITVAGLVAAVLAGIVLALGESRLAILPLFLNLFCDLLDGDVARLGQARHHRHADPVHEPRGHERAREGRHGSRHRAAARPTGGRVIEALIVNVLLAMMAVIAAAIVIQRNLFAVVVLGGIYSFLMATALVALDAVDVAMTEASVGAGISTVLLLGALHLVRGDEAKPLGRPWLPLAVSIAVGGVPVYGTLGLPAFSDPEAPIHKHVAPRYINESLKETGVPNVVTAVLASYRGYDTLGETTVVFTAGIGVIALLRQRKRKDRDRR